MNYQRIYDSICQRAKDQLEERSFNRKNKLQYYDGHHIIPRCMGGLGSSRNHNHPNIVLLTPKEHYICHRLLCKIYPGEYKLKYALFLFGRGNIEKVIPGTAWKPGNVPWNKNGNHSEKTKQILSSHKKGKTYEEIYGVEVAESKKRNMSATFKGHNVSNDTRIKIGLKHKGKKIPDEMRNRISETLKKYNKENPKTYTQVVCPHCNAIGGINVMHRWHFNNCINKSEE